MLAQIIIGWILIIASAVGLAISFILFIDTTGGQTGTYILLAILLLVAIITTFAILLRHYANIQNEHPVRFM